MLCHHNWNRLLAFSSMIWGALVQIIRKFGSNFPIRFFIENLIPDVTLIFSSYKKACCAIFLSICFMPSHVQWWVKLEIESKVYVQCTYTSLALGQKDKFYLQKPIDFLEMIFKKVMSSVHKNQQYIPNMNILFYNGVTKNKW